MTTRIEFLINTPYHQRWMLPDGEHYYNSVLYGDHFHISIWSNRTNQVVLSLPNIYIDRKGQWKDLLEIAQGLAEKRFAKKLTKAQEYARLESNRRK